MNRKNFMVSAHFSYEELTHSAWAKAHGMANTPDCIQIAALKNLCDKVLEPLHKQFGPITLNSAFRSEVVNVGEHGVGASRHLRGEAADIYFADEATGRAYFCFIKKNCDIDQLLFEYNRQGDMWLHVSTCLDSRENRHQVFPNYRVTYE